MGKLLLDDLRIDDALYYLQKALQINPKDSVTRYYLSIAYEEKGNYEAAIIELQKAIELNPAFTEYYERLQNIYKYLGKLSDADKINRKLNLLKQTGN